MNQTIIHGIARLDEIWTALRPRKVFLACGSSFDRLRMRDGLLPKNAEIVRFSAFAPNPRYEDAQSGAELFRRERCDVILAVGGGSAIDVAKCVKLYSGTDAPLLAVPTTAGTGSESTRHAVVYRNGVKQSIGDERLIPNYAILEPSVLEGLPVYQKKCTMLDALCQGIESWWSVNATEDSVSFSRAAVGGIAANWKRYLEENDPSAAAQILDAANASGCAINITATTAPHAMSYKLTSLYGLPHGHAVALCMGEVWPYLAAHTSGCIDPRGSEYLERVLREIDRVFSLEQYRALLAGLGMTYPAARDRERELSILTAAVNPERLKNNPVPLAESVLHAMYERILR